MDGGSSDGTQKMGERFGAKVFSQKDSGTSEAINRGLKIAKGEIIGIIGADDYYLPWAVSEAVRCFARHAASVVYGDTLLTDANGNNAIVAFNPIQPDIVPHLRYGFFNMQPFFWRREVFRMFGGFDADYRIRADYEFFVRVLPKLEVRKIDEVLAAYRYHPKGVSRDRQAFDIENARINRANHTESLIPNLGLARHAFWCAPAYAMQLIRFAYGSGWMNFRHDYKVSNVGLLCNIPLSVLYIFGVRLGRRLNHGFVKS